MIWKICSFELSSKWRFFGSYQELIVSYIINLIYHVSRKHFSNLPREKTVFLLCVGRKNICYIIHLLLLIVGEITFFFNNSVHMVGTLNCRVNLRVGCNKLKMHGNLLLNTCMTVTLTCYVFMSSSLCMLISDVFLNQILYCGANNLVLWQA